jgi:hypothetical protein
MGVALVTDEQEAVEPEFIGTAVTCLVKARRDQRWEDPAYGLTWFVKVRGGWYRVVGGYWPLIMLYRENLYRDRPVYGRYLTDAVDLVYVEDGQP